MTTRDATWWAVQDRLHNNRELAELLHRYLLGVDDFVTAALDALETQQELADEAEAEAEAEAMLAEDSPAGVAAAAALAALKQGEAAEKVVFDLLRVLVNPADVDAVVKTRTETQARQLRKQIAIRRDELRECSTELASLEKQLDTLVAGTATPKVG